MKFMKKISAILAVVLIFTASMSTQIFAAETATQDGLKATLTTDKDKYEIGDKVKVTVTVENTTTEAIDGVSYKITLPGNLEAVEGSVLEYEFGTIAAGESKEATVDTTATKSSQTGDYTTAGIIVACVVAAGAFAFAFKKKNKKAIVTTAVVILSTLAVAGTAVAVRAAVVDKSFEISKEILIGKNDATISATIKYKGEAEEETTTVTEETTTPDDDKKDEDTTGRVSVHDPSIIKDEASGTYYIFGSHLAWAKSTDLVNWTTFTNNINKDYRTIFADAFDWANNGDTVYDPSGNMWAPDVVYNKELGKWTMYMSINGCSWNSSIVMLTANSLDGDWTYVGPVVYSGFTASGTYALSGTDFEKATGSTTLDARYTMSAYTCKDGNTACASTTWNRRYGAHAIDPCVFYDDNGNLYMTYGSWSGGIYILELYENTGLRDYTKKYDYTANTSDPYMGVKIADGFGSTGEASYVQKIGDYYYLFITYGGLAAKGGYNMKVYRSESATGPYVDETGDAANFTSPYDDTNGTRGNRLMTYYKWSGMKYAQVAQGHNSAFVDSDGKAYVVYHTRTNDGSEGHSVRVHQLFTNADGWLVAAPYEYSGETLSSSAYTVDDVTGSYDVLVHKKDIDYANLEYVSPQTIELKGNGEITGELTGAWTLDSAKPYITLTIDGVAYKGVLVNQKVEGKTNKTLCFTALGSNEIAIWGSMNETGDAAIDNAVADITVPEGTLADMTLPTTGTSGVTISWKSSNTDALADDGTYKAPAENTNVTLTATFTSKGLSREVQYPVTVYKKNAQTSGDFTVKTLYTGAMNKLAVSTYSNPFSAKTINGLEIYNGVKIKFNYQRTGSMKGLGAIFSIKIKNADGNRLYLTDGSYLGYNATGGYFDANMANRAPVTDYIGTNKVAVEVDFTASGFSVKVDGVEKYNQSIITSTFDYVNVLTFLNTVANELNIGTGSFAVDIPEANIGDMEFIVNKLDTDPDYTGYAYAQTFTSATSAAATGWTSANLAAGLSIANDGDTYGKYLKFKMDGGSGNRGSVLTFPESAQLSGGNYTVESDIKLTPGNQIDRSETSFVIMGTDTSYKATAPNAGITSGYILKLHAKYTTAGGVAGKTIYAINDSAETVTIPSNTWVHVKTTVDVATGTATVTITNGTDTLYNGTVNVNGTGALGGLYSMVGRNGGINSVDNITVKAN